MKRMLAVLMMAALLVPVCLRAEEEAGEFLVYADKNTRQNHYVPSGWMGDYGDVTMNDQSMESPYLGVTCLRFSYTADKSQGQGWAGVYWQNPANNWGNKKGGFDLSAMNKLTFWARGEKGGEVVQKFVVGGIKGTYPDSTSVEMGPVELTDTWKQYSINLLGQDLSYINGGFGWVTTADLNPNGAVFYIDEIKFEADSELRPEAKLPETMPFYVFADRTSPNNHFVPSGWMGDYNDLKYDGSSADDPYLGDSCIKIVYNGKASQGARWAGMFWQHPANNWGNIDASYDLSKATKLTFWARGEKGGERIEEFKVGGIMGEYFDSDSAIIGPVILNKEWTQYTVDLTGKDMCYIIGGFCWAANIDNNPEGATFYLDEIKYE